MQNQEMVVQERDVYVLQQYSRITGVKGWKPRLPFCFISIHSAFLRRAVQEE
jgi:hypothetical protein